MPVIQCYYEDCRFLRGGICQAESVEITPEDGCLTFVMRVEPPEVNRWTDDDEIELEDTWGEMGYDEKDDDEADYWDDEY